LYQDTVTLSRSIGCGWAPEKTGTVKKNMILQSLNPFEQGQPDAVIDELLSIILCIILRKKRQEKAKPEFEGR
jgi:hypothetical protein